MAEILVERGFTHAHRLNAQCKNFKCKRDATDCCCRRLLYTQPDFVNVTSILEKHCGRREFRVLFLPKFHCELNFIEQCWGFSKRLYRQFPSSSKEVDLERNLVTALDSVPLEIMRQSVVHSDLIKSYLTNQQLCDSCTSLYGCI